jgi:aspartate aminotransferase
VIPPELEALLQPLERVEAIRRRAERLGDRLCDLSYANPYEGAQEQARAVLRDALERRRQLDLQYSPFGGRTLVRRAVADALRTSHDLDFRFGDVVLTPGAMAALHLALRAAGQPGAEVVIPVPCWLDYPLYVRFTGLVPMTVPLTERTFDLDVPSIADAISARTCAVLLSHPANPTGRNYAAGSLTELAAALREAESRFGRDLTVIADETHRDFAPGGGYQTLAAFFDRTILVYSFGKYHFMQGQRLGYAAVSPRHPARKEVSTEMVRWARVTGTATPTSLMQQAAPGLLALQYDQSRLGSWRARLVEELSRSGYEVVPPEATLFVYVKTPDSYDDFEFAGELASEGVLTLPAPVFHHSGYFRVSLTGSTDMLERVLPIFARVKPR